MNTKINNATRFGNIGQWLSVLIMGVGIYFLFDFGIDYGTILFSIGCLVQTLATKIKYYGDEAIKLNTDLLDIARERKRFKREEKKNAACDGLHNFYF
jgi:hypothetical protein